MAPSQLPEARRARYRLRHPLTPRACETCAVTFVPPTRSDARFCRRQCERAGELATARARRAAARPSRACPGCGEVFHVQRVDQWFCSSRCRFEVDGRKARYREVKRARKRGPGSEVIYRSVVWARDGGICGICGGAADPADWHVDHIEPLALGGAHRYDNVRVSHPGCNMRRPRRVWNGS